jgi:hypothetical protein
MSLLARSSETPWDRTVTNFLARLQSFIRTLWRDV